VGVKTEETAAIPDGLFLKRSYEKAYRLKILV